MTEEALQSVILVVEDDVLLRVDTVNVLEEAGFTVLEAGNADEAIRILEARKDVSILFTDIQMPGSMDGIRLAECVRNRWPPVEIIITSGQIGIRDSDLPERGLYFPKPFAPNEVIAAMRKFVDTTNG